MFEDMIRSSALWQGVVLPVRSRLELLNWYRNSRPAPVPHAVKIRNLLCLADLYNIDVLVETGTHKGQMIDATVDRFKRIYSIEIFEPLAARAKQRFSSNPKVTIINADSATALPNLLPTIAQPILFWLDGHYSGQGTGMGAEESPVIAEIEHILNLRQGFSDLIVIDDARCFTGAGGYPALSEFIVSLQEYFGRQLKVANDAIFILP